MWEYKLETTNSMIFNVIFVLYFWTVVVFKDEMVTCSVEMHALQTRLLSNYSVNVRPVKNETDVVTISVVMIFEHVLGLDLKEQTLKSSGYMDIWWRDVSLTWDPEDYANITDLLLPQSLVWLPDVVIANDVRQIRFFGNDRTLVNLKHDGTIAWQPDFIVETGCDVNIYKYPFDSQQCEIEVLPWMMTSQYANITYPDIDISTVKVNEEFVLSETWAYPLKYDMSYSISGAYLPAGRFVLVLQRRYLFYLLSTVLPLAAFSLLPPLAFIVPAESGEKITLSVTVLLANVVFLSSLSDSIPRVSDSISIFVLYASLQIILSFVAVIACVFSLVIAHDHTDDVTPEHGAESDDGATWNTDTHQQAGFFNGKLKRLFTGLIRFRTPTHRNPFEPSKHVKAVVAMPNTTSAERRKEFENIFSLKEEPVTSQDTNETSFVKKGSVRGDKSSKRRSSMRRRDRACFAVVFVFVVIVNIVTIAALAM